MTASLEPVATAEAEEARAEASAEAGEARAEARAEAEEARARARAGARAEAMVEAKAGVWNGSCP